MQRHVRISIVLGLLTLGTAGSAGATPFTIAPFTTAHLRGAEPERLTTVGGPTTLQLFDQQVISDFNLNSFSGAGPQLVYQSIWQDDFTITGSGFLAPVTVTWRLDGQLSPDASPVGCQPPELFECRTSVVYRGLLIPAGSLGQDLRLFSAFLLCCGETLTVAQSDFIKFEFPYGQPFGLQFDLEGSTAFGSGSLDFLGTVIDIEIPKGASLSAASGTQYPVSNSTAVPIPEPATVLLVGFGLLAHRKMFWKASRPR